MGLNGDKSTFSNANRNTFQMTPRQRVFALLRGENPDQVPWFGDLDYWAAARIGRKEVPGDFKQSDAYIQWHRDLGVGYYLQGYSPFTTVIENGEVREWQEGNHRHRTVRTPKGTLHECWQYLPESFTEAPTEHLVKTEDDLPALRHVYENTRYEPDYVFARKRLDQVGEIGIVLCYLPKSPLMQLVVLDAGIEAVVSMIADAPDEFSETIRVIRTAHNQAAQIALDSPAEVLMIPENLSSEMIGPRLFDRFMREYQEEWARRIAANGKYSFVHIDGTLRGLLRKESETGISVLEAMTPRPVGDLAIEEWGDLAGNSKTILWGGIPGVYFTPLVSDGEFDRHLKEVLAVMRTEPRYVLGVADQVPPDALESRVREVKNLVDEFGVYE